ncbi:hypothetical protein [Halocatena salina]|uniref:Uncharacterized protein n=1 Tax=Halocatena salina TaxID=2934340 RepID=A0A8U0AA75_9EURY|nr:hypothetical protein [Halocatena salina]UPM44853.1 hypothetical protein MW046_15810 [Halocatena salina]
MSRFNRSLSPAYQAFVSTVQEYADDDQEPGEGVRRAIADALEDELRERFKNAWKVDEQAEKPCFRRLITGEDECSCDRSWIDRELETVGKGERPPHKPPHSDHASLWLDEDGEPAIFSIHVYHPEIQSVSKTADPEQSQRNGWFDIVECAKHWGLEIAVMPTS